MKNINKNQGGFYNKYNFIIKNFCASNSSELDGLGGVFITPKETVATNSFMLARVDSVKENPADYPEIPNKPKMKTNFKSFILPKEKASDVASLFKKKNNIAVPIINNAVVLKRDEKENLVEIGKTDLESYQGITSKIIRGEYPRYNDILVEKGKHIEISVNPVFLKKIADFFTTFIEDGKGVKIRIPKDSKSPIRFFAEKESTKQKADVLLIPISI